MLIRLNTIMRNFKKKGKYPMLFVVDRVERDVVVLIVDILYEEREQAEELVKKISDLLDAHNVRMLDYKLASYIVPFKEMWRFVATVAVNHSQ